MNAKQKGAYLGGSLCTEEGCLEVATAADLNEGGRTLWT